MSLSDDINKTSTSLANIKNAIIAKGTTPSGDITTYAAAIGDITTVDNENKTVSPSTTQQSVTHSAGKTGLGTVVVNAVTSAIDSNIVASNIKKNVEILGVQGSYEGESANITTLSVTPSTTAQTITAPSGTDGYSPVKVAPVTASIDENIIASNIKKNVEILGVQGSYEGSSTLTTKTITENGTYNASSDNVDGYSKVTVNVSGGSSLGINREVVNGVYKMPTTSFTFSLPSNVVDIGPSALYHAFESCTGLIGASLYSLTTLSGSGAMSYAFSKCTNLTSVDLSGLVTISGSNAMSYAFNNCTGLTGLLDLSSLTTLSGSNAMQNAFSGCTGLTSVNLSNLTTLSGQDAMRGAFSSCSNLVGALDLSNLSILGGFALASAFSRCELLTSVNLSSLESVNDTQSMSMTFLNCTSLTNVNLSNLTTISGSQGMSSTFSGCTGLTSIDLSSLATVSSSSAMERTFSGCTGLASVDLSGLQVIGINSSSTNTSQFSSCFSNCNNLTSLMFTNLEKIYCTGTSTTSNGTFANNNKVEKMYFPKLDTITYGTGASTSNQEACKNIFYGCSSLTELHFGAANQAAIEASPGYSTAWGRGAGNVTIYFDL